MCMCVCVCVCLLCIAFCHVYVLRAGHQKLLLSCRVSFQPQKGAKNMHNCGAPHAAYA